MPRTDALPAKAVNQYRGRDIFAYLGLRYYVENELAQRNEWAEQNAIQIVLGSPQGSYLRSYHFKQLGDDGKIEHRRLMIPSASEALAEAVLLAQCHTFHQR